MINMKEKELGHFQTEKNTKDYFMKVIWRVKALGSILIKVN